MDLSSSSEFQKQQLQQQFDEHQQQEEYNQGYASKPCIPSEFQPYNSQQNSQQPQQQQSQPESAGPINPPEKSEAPLPVFESSDTGTAGSWQGQSHVEHQENVYNPQLVGVGGDQSNLGFPGLNPAAAAAIAALSQLTQFAGTMGAAERVLMELQQQQWFANSGGYGPMMGPGSGPGLFMGPGQMHYGGVPVGQSSYRGTGRRGGGQFRGGGRGRGWGRGTPRRYPPNGASSSSKPEHSAALETETAKDGTEHSAEHNEAVGAEISHQKSVSAQGNAPPSQQPVRVARCELCKVDCNSLEILEQHKNGKKHKKNLQRLGKSKSLDEPSAETHSNEKRVADSSVEGQNAQEGKVNKQILPENFPIEAGKKRKLKSGRGGKRMKTHNAQWQSVEPPKPKVVIPLICDLCNVKCDTQEVFDRHLSGKKHVSKFKRYEDHQAMYGPAGLQALYPPNPITQTLFQPQGPQQAFYGPQGSHPPPGDYMLPHNPHAALATTSTGFVNQQNTIPKVSDATPSFTG